MVYSEVQFRESAPAGSWFSTALVKDTHIIYNKKKKIRESKRKLTSKKKNNL